MEVINSQRTRMMPKSPATRLTCKHLSMGIKLLPSKAWTSAMPLQSAGFLPLMLYCSTAHRAHESSLDVLDVLSEQLLYVEGLDLPQHSCSRVAALLP